MMTKGTWYPGWEPGTKKRPSGKDWGDVNERGLRLIIIRVHWLWQMSHANERCWLQGETGHQALGIVLYWFHNFFCKSKYILKQELYWKEMERPPFSVCLSLHPTPEATPLIPTGWQTETQCQAQVSRTCAGFRDTQHHPLLKSTQFSQEGNTATPGYALSERWLQEPTSHSGSHTGSLSYPGHRQQVGMWATGSFPRVFAPSIIVRTEGTSDGIRCAGPGRGARQEGCCIYTRGNFPLPPCALPRLAPPCLINSWDPKYTSN